MGVAVSAAVLIGANLLIEGAEDQGLIDTIRPDDLQQFVDEDLFVVRGDRIVTTPYAQRSLVPVDLPADGGDGWRLVLTGGSFAQGPIEGEGGQRHECPGGIASWLRAELESGHPGRPIDVVNLGAGGQDSNRVRRMAEAALALEPDVLVVASCNNEGWESPDRVTQQLRKLGGYRLLSRLLHPSPDAAARPLHSLQSPHTDSIREAFRANLVAMAEAASGAGVPLVLATLPVNLRYQGTSYAHIDNPIGELWEPPDGEAEAPCVAEGRAALEAGEIESARAALERCDDVAHALRVLGQVELAAGHPEAARTAFESSLELVPYNRCRPSFQAVIRQVAGEHGALLLDLEAHTQTLAPAGLPGDELFRDYCHMHWWGYLAVARAIGVLLDEHGLGPPWPRDAESADAWEARWRSEGTRAFEGRGASPQCPRNGLPGPSPIEIP